MNDTSRSVYFLPSEYLTYGVAGTRNITTRPTGIKEYAIADHLGSTRVLLSVAGTLSETDYEPFGGVIAQTGTNSRLSFIDKEKDAENGLGDFGVRKYDDDLGRFTSIDPLWEKFRGESPYQYSLNNPIIGKDDNGKLVIFVNGFNGNPTEHKYGSAEPIYRQDPTNYWGGMANAFMDRIGDYNSVFLSASDGALTSATQRYSRGVAAGEAMLEQIRNGDISMGEGESIKVVTHSQGAAYGAGVTAVLTNAGFNVEVAYNIAPKQPGDINLPPGIGRIVQYSSTGDWVAPQDPLSRAERWFLPKDLQSNLTGGHRVEYYYGIFDITEGKSGYIPYGPTPNGYPEP